MLIIIFLYSSLANIALGQFIPNAEPITIKNQSNKKYKFDADLLNERGDEPTTEVNLNAQGATVSLKRGGNIKFAINLPFGGSDEATAILLKGNVTLIKRGGSVNFFGKAITFFQTNQFGNGFTVPIPSDISKGDYKLILVIKPNQEIEVFYITNAKIS